MYALDNLKPCICLRVFVQRLCMVVTGILLLHRDTDQMNRIGPQVVLWWYSTTASLYKPNE